MVLNWAQFQSMPCTLRLMFQTATGVVLYIYVSPIYLCSEPQQSCCPWSPETPWPLDTYEPKVTHRHWQEHWMAKHDTWQNRFTSAPVAKGAVSQLEILQPQPRLHADLLHALKYCGLCYSYKGGQMKSPKNPNNWTETFNTLKLLILYLYLKGQLLHRFKMIILYKHYN